MKKNLIRGLILCMFLYFFIMGCENTVEEIDIEIGDYIQFASYYDEPILWRVINIDEDGNPLLFSDRIISLKAFDAAGSYHKDKERIKTGSNYWKDSNIRQWLNSDEEAGKIRWIQNPPSQENMFEGYGPYEDEKGFLADGNFTQAERSIIKSSLHKSVLHRLDVDKKDGGAENILPNSRIQGIVENYDNSNYQIVEDKVFLLSIKELHGYVWENRSILGKDYYIGKPTKEAVQHSPVEDEELDYNNNWDYWLRTPQTTSMTNIIDASFVRSIHSNGSVFSYFASFGGWGGVRPALYLEIKGLNIKSGNGEKESPYVLSVL